jgi:hypothetical protein
MRVVKQSGILVFLAACALAQGNRALGQTAHALGATAPPRAATPSGSLTAHPQPRNSVVPPRFPGGATGARARFGGAAQSPGQHATVVTHMHDGGVRTEHVFSGGARVFEVTRQLPGRGSVHAVRYGEGLNGVVDHSARPGYFVRTYVQGGRIAYARVYQEHVLHRFGRTFSYQSVVPAIAFSPAYYGWAAHSWSGPVTYRWGWQKQRWYASFGDYFTPYDAYASLDLWMTDYLLAQNLRSAYDAWQASTAATAQALGGSAADTTQESGAAPSGDDAAAASDTSQVADGPPPPEESPPPITPDVKQELDAQIKLQLQERQSGKTAQSDDDLPGALKPGHKLFRVIASLDVDSDTPGKVCALNSNDYIERTGDLDHDGMVPVEVKLSGISDCGEGLATRVSANDLEAMDSEQQEQLTNAMLAAANSMGPSGLPKGPATSPLLVAAGQAQPAPDALSTLHQLQ